MNKDFDYRIKYSDRKSEKELLGIGFFVDSNNVIPEHVMENHVRVLHEIFGQEYTIRDFEVLTRRFAAALKDMGLKKGDIVALWLPNCPQFAITYFAAVYLGATLTAISPLFTSRELAYQINDSGAKYLITIDQFVREYEKVAEKLSLNK